MIVLNSPAGIVVFLAGLLSVVGTVIAAVTLVLNRKKQESVENE